MASFNRVTLIGNITRDIDLKYTPKGSPIADFSLAINRVWVNDRSEKIEDTIFIPVTLFGKQATNLQQYCGKGSMIHIEGRLHIEEWDDKTTGNRRQKMKVIGETVQYLVTKPPASSAPDKGDNQPPANYVRGDHPEDHDLEPEADDIPF